MRIGISKAFSFEAAHQLPHYIGKCADLHGHTYKLRVTVVGDSKDMDKSGIIIDFGTLKRVVNEAVIDLYDHKLLNDFFSIPSAEVMVRTMFLDIKRALAKVAPQVTLTNVRLWEGDGGNWAEVDALSAIQDVSVFVGGTDE